MGATARGGVRGGRAAAAGASAAAALVRELERAAVGVVFGLPGVHNLPIWDALDGAGPRLVGVRHEQAAVYAADGLARASGRTGVAVVTTGPGAANTLGATGEALASGVAVVVVATDVPTALRRPGVLRGALHETRDQAALFAPVTKATLVAERAADVPVLVREALALAARPPAGPVYLGIPTDLLDQPAPPEPSAPGPAPTPAADGVPAAPSPAAQRALADAAALLAGARRPLIWAGGGALRGGAGPALGELAARLGAPVLTTYAAKGLLGREHPCAVHASPHAPEVGALWDGADVVLAVGSDLDGMSTQNWAMPAPPRLVAVNVDPADATKNYAAAVVVAADAAAGARALLALLPGPPAPSPRPRLDAVHAAVAERIAADEPQAPGLLAALSRALPDAAVLVADMCIPGYWAAGFWPAPRPRSFAYPVGWGTLGYAFPAALGAALAGGGPAVALCGDGGFLFAAGELATVAQERPPLTVVIVDDGGYGMLRFDQAVAGRAPFGVDLATPDFVALAAAFGLCAEAVDGVGETFAERLAAHVADPEPTVLVARAALRPPLTTSPRWYRRRALLDPQGA